jgi:hypothetical protein
MSYICSYVSYLSLETTFLPNVGPYGAEKLYQIRIIYKGVVKTTVREFS